MPEEVRVLDVETGHLGRVLGRGDAELLGRVVDLVVHVGDVHDDRRLVAQVTKQPAEQHEDDVGPRVADVDPPVDGGPAGVDARAAGFARLERAHLARKRVLDPHLAHGAHPRCG